jgi:hypothetical protein
MIIFNKNIELNIITDFNEADDNIEGEEIILFPAGEPIDAEIISTDGDYVDLEFHNGVALGVKRDAFNVIP